MFCSHCGKPLVPDGRFCPYCGSPVSPPAFSPPPAAPAPEPPHPGRTQIVVNRQALAAQRSLAAQGLSTHRAMKEAVETSPQPTPPPDRPNGFGTVANEGRKAGSKMAFELRAGVAIRFVWCPPGMFLMGSPDDEEGHVPTEARHSVFLTHGFWIGQVPVTQAQWMVVMGRNPSKFSLGADYPVECVSWNDAQDYVRRLNSGARGLGSFALPTEAQWEYACRAGTETAYAGDLNRMAWYCPNSNGGTHPVAELAPNAWGIHDMHGNVWEWCHDAFLPDLSDQGMDPHGPEDSVPGRLPHVFRGGAWSYGAVSCRSAFRAHNQPDFTAPVLGLRLVFNPAARDPAATGPKYRIKR